MNKACSGDERRLVHEVNTNNTNINNTKLTRYIPSETEEEAPSEKAIVQQQERKKCVNPSSNTGTKKDYQTPCTDAEDRIQNQSKIKHLRCRGIRKPLITITPC